MRHDNLPDDVSPSDPRAPWNEPDWEADWEKVRAELIEEYVDEIDNGGLDTAPIHQLLTRPNVQQRYLRDLLDDCLHKLLIARSGDEQIELLSELKRDLRPYVIDWIDGWDRKRKLEYLSDRAERDARDPDDDCED